MLEEYINQIKPLDSNAINQAKCRWDSIAKPLSSLGKLEKITAQIAGIQRTHKIDISKPVVCVMCADNGVVAQGVTQVGSEVTAIVAENMTKGQSAVCIMANSLGANVSVVDVGINQNTNIKGIINKKIMFGTNDISEGFAMTKEQALSAIKAGIDIAVSHKEKGYNIILTGEMGIGNTTTSSAIASVMLEKSVESVTGKGAGLCSDGLKRKIEVIKKAIEINKPNKNDALDVLHKLGGLDIASMAGLYIGGAICGIPVVIDGFISGIAALIAKSLVPNCGDYMISSHISAEPAGKMLLSALNMEPMVTCDMCLGEGTGAVAALSLIQLGTKVYNTMSSFSEANIEQYKHFED